MIIFYVRHTIFSNFTPSDLSPGPTQRRAEGPIHLDVVARTRRLAERAGSSLSARVAVGTKQAHTQTRWSIW